MCPQKGTAYVYLGTCNEMKNYKKTSVNRLECATINEKCINNQWIRQDPLNKQNRGANKNQR